MPHNGSMHNEGFQEMRMVKAEPGCRMQIMTKKKSKAIIPLFSNPKKGLLAREATLEIGLNPDEKAQEIYLQDHILNLEEEIKSLSHAKEQIAHLKAFRDILSGHCIFKGQRITLIQCSGFWKSKQCTFEQCKTRKPWTSFF